jgi:hypothetical protein
LEHAWDGQQATNVSIGCADREALDKKEPVDSDSKDLIYYFKKNDYVQ